MACRKGTLCRTGYTASGLSKQCLPPYRLHTSLLGVLEPVVWQPFEAHLEELDGSFLIALCLCVCTIPGLAVGRRKWAVTALEQSDCSGGRKLVKQQVVRY